MTPRSFRPAPRNRGVEAAFARLAAIAVTASEQLVELLDRLPERAELADAIRTLEHEGDAQLHAIRAAVQQGPDKRAGRQAELELGSALDDVIDLTEEIADYLMLLGIEAPMEQAQSLARTLESATRQIALALPLIWEGGDVTPHTREIHRLENEGDRLSRAAIASLFRDGIDPMVVIRWKDIFERLEEAIDATECVADRIDEVTVGR